MAVSVRLCMNGSRPPEATSGRVTWVKVGAVYDWSMWNGNNLEECTHHSRSLNQDTKGFFNGKNTSSPSVGINGKMIETD